MRSFAFGPVGGPGVGRLAAGGGIALGALGVALGLLACDGGGEAGEPGGEGSEANPSAIGAPQFDFGTPALGAECHIGPDGGYELGGYMADAELIGCDGNPVTFRETFCGAAVGWTYYFLGAG